MKYYLRIILFFHLLLANKLAAQVITFLGNNQVNLDYPFQIILNHPFPTQTILKIKTYQQNQLIHQKEIQPISLQVGQQILNPNLLRIKKEQYANKSIERIVKTTGKLPLGIYQVCLIATSTDGGAEFGRHCEESIVKETETIATTKKLYVFGTGRIEHVWSNQQYFGTSLPPQYARISLQPDFQWQDIPFGLTVFHTTVDQLSGQNPNVVSLRFDAMEFRTQIRKKLESKLRANTQKIQASYQLDFLQEQNLEKRLAALKDSSFLKIKEELPQLKTRLNQAKEKELQHLERKLKAKLDANRTALETQKKEWLQKDSALYSTKLDSLQQAQQQWQEKHQHELQKLDSLRKKLQEVAKLKRKVKKYQQQIRQYQQLQNSETILHTSLSKITAQNDSLRQQLAAVDYSNPTELKNRLKTEGLLTAQNSWLYSLKKLSIGTYQPNYSPLILGRLQANGAAVQFSPDDKWQIAASYGKAQIPLFGLNSFSETDFMEPNVLAGKLGWEQQNFSVYFTAAHPFQKEDSQEDALNEVITTNNLLGTGLSFYLPEQNFNASFDGAITQFKSSTKSYPSLKERTAIQANFDWQITEQYNFSMIYQTLGTDYEDIGSPLTLPGMEQLDMQLSGNFSKLNLRTGLYYLKEENRPISFTPFTFQNHQYGVNLTWQAPKLPRINARLGRNLLKRAELIGNANTWLWSVQLSHPYQWKGISMTSQINYQNTQQQPDPQLPAQLYTFWEVRQQFNWRTNFSSSFSAYNNFGGQSGNQIDLKGMDFSSILSVKKMQLHLSAGWYQQNNTSPQFRYNLGGKLTLSKLLNVQITGGIFPSLVQENGYQFLRTTLVALF